MSWKLFTSLMLDAIAGYFLDCKVSSSLPHTLSSTVESIFLDFTGILLGGCPGIHQDDKGNENPIPKAVWMSMSKQIKEVNKPEPHSLVINKKTEGEDTDYLPRTGWNTNWIFLLPLKMSTFSSAHHFYMSYFHNLRNTLNNCLGPKKNNLISGLVKKKL